MMYLIFYMEPPCQILPVVQLSLVQLLMFILDSRYTPLNMCLSFSFSVTCIIYLNISSQLGEFYVPSRIVSIDNLFDCYYISCSTRGCNKKLDKSYGLMTCSKCGKAWHQGTVRYKLKVQVVDKSDDAFFMLWDWECVEILGVSAHALREK